MAKVGLSEREKFTTEQTKLSSTTHSNHAEYSTNTEELGQYRAVECRVGKTR